MANVVEFPKPPSETGFFLVRPRAVWAVELLGWLGLASLCVRAAIHNYSPWYFLAIFLFAISVGLMIYTGPRVYRDASLRRRVFIVVVQGLVVLFVALSYLAPL